MLDKIKEYMRRVPAMAERYKYLITIVIGVLVVGFIGENSYLQQAKNARQITHLKNEIEPYEESYREASTKLSRLYTDPEAIEKIARERYFMKTDDEDIFVLSDDAVKEEPGL